MMDVFLCGMCRSFLGDPDHWPRVLACGHSLCSSCISHYLQSNNIKCPACGFVYYVGEHIQIPLNHTILKIMKAQFGENMVALQSLQSAQNELVCQGSFSPVSQQNSPESRNERSGLTCDKIISNKNNTSKTVKRSPTSEPSDHAGLCKTHGEYLTFWCKKCEEWTCGECIMVEHLDAECLITSVPQAIHEMKLREDLSIKNTVELVDRHMAKYRNKHRTYRNLQNNHRMIVTQLLLLISKHQKSATDLDKQDRIIQTTIEKGLHLQQELVESQEYLLDAQTLRELFEMRHIAQLWQESLLCWYDPMLLNQTSEIVRSNELQKSTALALAVMKQCMEVSSDMQVKAQINDFKSLSMEDGPPINRIKQVMQSAGWKELYAKFWDTDSVDCNSLPRLAKGTRFIDTKLYDEISHGPKRASPAPLKEGKPLKGILKKSKIREEISPPMRNQPRVVDTSNELEYYNDFKKCSWYSNVRDVRRSLGSNFKKMGEDGGNRTTVTKDTIGKGASPDKSRRFKSCQSDNKPSQDTSVRPKHSRFPSLRYDESKDSIRDESINHRDIPKEERLFNKEDRLRGKQSNIVRLVDIDFAKEKISYKGDCQKPKREQRPSNVLDFESSEEIRGKISNFVFDEANAIVVSAKNINKASTSYSNQERSVTETNNANEAVEVLTENKESSLVGCRSIASNTDEVDCENTEKVDNEEAVASIPSIRRVNDQHKEMTAKSDISVRKEGHPKTFSERWLWSPFSKK